MSKCVGFLCVCLAATSLALAQAGAAAKAGNLYAFSPPMGWGLFTQTNFADRADADWRGPASNGFAENILVIVVPAKQTLSEATDDKAIETGLPGAQVSRQTTNVCGGHNAMYLYIRAPWHGQTLISEQMLSVWGKVMYQAIYSHLSVQQPIEAARSSLTTLCPASQPSSTSW